MAPDRTAHDAAPRAMSKMRGSSVPMPADVQPAADRRTDTGALAADTAPRPLSADSDRSRTLAVRRFRGDTLPV
jgi:hypothetical protein